MLQSGGGPGAGLAAGKLDCAQRNVRVDRRDRVGARKHDVLGLELGIGALRRRLRKVERRKSLPAKVGGGRVRCGGRGVPADQRVPSDFAGSSRITGELWSITQ
jgi:hypothetical protein